MLKHTSITLARIERFGVALRDQVVKAAHPLSVELCPVDHPDEETARRLGPWSPAACGARWGPAYRQVWFRVKGDLPAEWAGRSVGLRAELAGESTLWRDNVPVRGMDEPHPIARLWDEAPAGQTLDLLLSAHARNAQVSVYHEPKPRAEFTETIGAVELVWIDEDLLGLRYDVEFFTGILKALPDSDPSFATMIRALNEVCNRFDPVRPGSAQRCRKILKEASGSLNGEVKHTIFPVGHAHLDTAWLWPLRVTREKMMHTAATQLGLMERYPEYVFAHSQASQYEWLEQRWPSLFEKVAQAVASGQWEPVGSMWVEADCNLSGGESLVRQFLYGKRYFREKFGYETADMWLPDVFGYSAALPQILAKSGIRYFLTQKMSWNQYNKMPHHTFWWQGIDGTRVWAHFPPADTYNGNATPQEISFSVKNFKDQGRCDMSLYLYGFGDGGGGPTELHLELLRRARTGPNLPAVESGRRALDFFREAYTKSRDLCTWVGELYLEYHRGTYTSQAANKKANRECEFLLRDAELLSCFHPGFPRTYPAAELERLWKLVLLNQFHDIIPGSSVTEVYEDSARDYAEVREAASRIVGDALCALAGKMDTASMERPVALFQNATIPGLAAIPWEDSAVPASVRSSDGAAPVQLTEAFGERVLLFQAPEASLGSVAVADLSDAPPIRRGRLKAGPRRIENDAWSVRFDPQGNIVSVTPLDDAPVEFIEPGALANLFQLFDDQPLNWDAWDVEAYALETGKDLDRSESFEIVERGPVRVAAEVVKRFGGSSIRQRISLGPSPGIRFDTEVHWRESRKLLKVAFPLNVNAHRATFEIQFGHVERPTHQNTSWDMAKFEVCAHKWVDVSENGHGVALLNDGKYGHDVKGNVLRLSLLRSPKAPDPACDMGVHRFTYVLLPHFHAFHEADVVAAAYSLNAPVRWRLLRPSSGESGELPSFVSVATRNLVIESVKKAEDSNLLVVRMYECHNTRGVAEMTCARGIRRAWAADLMENPVADLEIQDGAVLVVYRPFEIVTVLLEV
jgi:alpha-mannosidase